MRVPARIVVSRNPADSGSSGPGGWSGVGRRRRLRSFTLLEVMIAMALFFMAVFAILNVVSQGLGAARGFQTEWPDIGLLTTDLLLTNRLEEGIEEGDFGDLHPEWRWRRELVEVATNGLFQVEFTIQGVVNGRPRESTAHLLLWRPESQSVIPGLRR
jgi:hypothetical protein